MSVPAAFLDLQPRILPNVRQSIVKLEFLPLDGQTFLDLNVKPVIAQMKYGHAVHLTSPDELRPILREECTSEQENRRYTHGSHCT